MSIDALSNSPSDAIVAPQSITSPSGMRPTSEPWQVSARFATARPAVWMTKIAASVTSNDPRPCKEPSFNFDLLGAEDRVTTYPGLPGILLLASTGFRFIPGGPVPGQGLFSSGYGHMALKGFLGAPRKILNKRRPRLGQVS